MVEGNPDRSGSSALRYGKGISKSARCWPNVYPSVRMDATNSLDVEYIFFLSYVWLSGVGMFGLFFFNASVCSVHWQRTALDFILLRAFCLFLCFLWSQLWMAQCKAGFHSVTAKCSILMVCCLIVGLWVSATKRAASEHNSEEVCRITPTDINNLWLQRLHIQSVWAAQLSAMFCSRTLMDLISSDNGSCITHHFCTAVLLVDRDRH